MRPLQSIAMGLVVIVLDTLGTVDALPDPLGWVLVLVGVRRLPHDLRHRGLLLVLALLAGAVSVPLWLPGIADALYDTHPSLLWAANLPQLGFAGVLCRRLAGRAAEDGDPRSAAWLRTTLVGIVVVALLPVLVFGAGVTSLEVPTYLGATAVLLMLVWLLFSYSGRTWASPVTPAQELPT